MYCLPCFNRGKGSNVLAVVGERPPPGEALADVPESSHAQVFNFRELAMATKTFREECLLGEGGFGRVYRGQLRGSDQVVAVKKLDRNGMEESKEFKAEAMKLSLLNHPNLVKLIGYCADGDQRLLVYEYMSMGSLEQHLYGDDPEKKPLDWATRMKIASGAAQGLQYLHENVNPPVVYGDFKPSNVLLNKDFEPKLSDVGLSKLGAGDGKTQPSSSRMMGTFGYSSPEYSRGEEVTIKSDIYSFGVVLLELITGRRAIDTTRPTDEQNLVTWAQPFFRDPKRFSEMADPKLQKDFPTTSLNQAVGIAAMCLQDEPMVRPHITDVTSVLGCICMVPSSSVPLFSPPSQQKMEYEIVIHSDTSSTHEDEEDIEQCDTYSSSSGCPFSDGESGLDSESVDQSDEESTYPSSGGSSIRDALKKQGASSSKIVSRKKSTSSHKTVVTFKEPSPSSRYSANGKLERRGGESLGDLGQENSE